MRTSVMRIVASGLLIGATDVAGMRHADPDSHAETLTETQAGSPVEPASLAQVGLPVTATNFLPAQGVRITGADAVVPVHGTVEPALPPNHVTLITSVTGNAEPVDPQRHYLLYDRSAPGGPAERSGRLVITSISLSVSSDGLPAATEIQVMATDCVGGRNGWREMGGRHF